MPRTEMRELFERARTDNDPDALYEIARFMMEHFPEAAPFWYEKASAADETRRSLRMQAFLDDVFAVEEDMVPVGADEPDSEEDWVESYSEDEDEDFEDDSFEKMFEHSMAAHKGDAKAALWLFDKYLEEANEEKASEYLRMAALSGEPDGQFWFANELLYADEDPNKWAIYWFARSSENNADATYELASNYLDGFCVDRVDEKRALARFELAARQGSAKGAFMGGEMYFTGFTGVDRDEAKALKFWKQAENLGYAPAVFEIGMCHLLGLCSFERSQSKAEELFRTAAAGGSKEACEELATLKGFTAEGLKWQRLGEKLLPHQSAIRDWLESQPIQMRVRKPDLQLIKK